MRFRSFLFTPASRLDRLPQARASGADWIILDLEDGVAETDREAARHSVSQLLPENPHGLHNLAVRVSALATPDGIRDIAMLLDQEFWPEMLVLPKVESAKEVQQIHSVATSLGKSPWLMAMLETAPALSDPVFILRNCGPNVVAAYGSGDHAAQIGASMSEVGLAWARGQVVNAGAVAGVPVIDGACLDLKNAEALQSEARLAREMGFSGKFAVHPCQVDWINAVFTPSKEEAERARAMISAYEAAGGGAISFEGTMVDGPILANAHRILASFGSEH